MRPASSAFSSALGGSSSGPGDRSGLDIVRLSKRSKTEIERTSSATGQEGEGASVATGQAVGGSPTSQVGRGATLSLPGLKIYWPSSQLILGGVKSVEARPYALGFRNIARPDVEMWLVETPSQGYAISNGWVFADGAAVAPMPEKAQIVGTVTFSRSDEYGSLRAFRADRKNHRIAEGGQYDWDGTGKRYAWRVSAVRRLAQPVPQPGGMYATGFTKNRPFTVSFAEAASIVGLRRGEGASAAVPSGKEGHRAATRKRSTPASQGSAASAAAPKTRKRSKIPEVSRRAQDHLEKRPEEEDYTVAAVVKESIAAIMIDGTCSRRNRGRCKTDWSVVTSAGHGSQTATGTMVASATSASDAVANRVVGEEEEQRRAGLAKEGHRGAASAQEHISTLMGAEPCSHRVAVSGGTDAGRRHSAMDSSKGELSSIEYLVGRSPRACLPVRLEGVTLLSIGKVWDPPFNNQWPGQGKGRGKGKKGKKGQPVYFGDDIGRVICTLATGDDVNRIPVTFPRNAYVDISCLMPQAGQLGLLHWTESTQMSLRMRPRDSGCNYIFPYDVMSEYSKDLASMAFVQQCAAGSYVAIAMRITEVQPRWTSVQNRPYLQLWGVDTEGGVVGPLRLWQLEEGDIRIGGAYVVRGLKVVHDRWWDSARGIWIRFAVQRAACFCNV